MRDPVSDLDRRGKAIFAAVLAFNVMGDALRDVLDPKLRNRDASQ